MPTEHVSAAEWRRQHGLPPAGEDRQRPPRLPAQQPERTLVIDIADWLRAERAAGRLRARFTHIAHERMGVAARVLAWRMGVEAGAPDFVFALDGARTGWIEVKADASLSREQREWRDDLQSFGHLWVLARSLEEVRETLRAWGAWG